jgi:hypothetical protein
VCVCVRSSMETDHALQPKAGADELANAKASMAEMDRLRDELDREAADRKRLEAEIMSLKGAQLRRPLRRVVRVGVALLTDSACIPGEMEKLYGETSTVSAPAPAPASDERGTTRGRQDAGGPCG